jgi:hypothetical protein
VNIRNILLLIISHVVAVSFGFALGIYALPILTAPTAPSVTQVSAVANFAKYSANFHRNLEGSDILHWGEGEVSIGPSSISLRGKLAPGPDYKLYLSPEFVETEAGFNRLKSRMVVVGDVKTFNNFLVELPSTINPSDYTTVIVWCESFAEFITSAKYRP